LNHEGTKNPKGFTETYEKASDTAQKNAFFVNPFVFFVPSWLIFFFLHAAAFGSHLDGLGSYLLHKSSAGVRHWHAVFR